MTVGREEETKVVLTAGRTLLLHYTAVQQVPEPPRRSSPSGEHHSTPGLAFLHAVIEKTQTREMKKENVEKCHSLHTQK